MAWMAILVVNLSVSFPFLQSRNDQIIGSLICIIIANVVRKFVSKLTYTEWLQKEYDRINTNYQALLSAQDFYPTLCLYCIKLSPLVYEYPSLSYYGKLLWIRSAQDNSIGGYKLVDVYALSKANDEGKIPDRHEVDCFKYINAYEQTFGSIKDNSPYLISFGTEDMNKSQIVAHYFSLHDEGKKSLIKELSTRLEKYEQELHKVNIILG